MRRLPLGALGVVAAILPLLVACQDPGAGPPSASAESRPRIATLAPNLAELAFAAGAGESLVGVSAYSDYPPAVESLPLIGDAFTIDQERLALLRPDLLLAWESGTPAHVVDELRQAGYTVEVIRTRSLADISTALVRIGELAGTGSHARDVAADFAASLQQLRDRYGTAEPVRVFFQVSDRPLYTVGRAHYVSELIELCGGSNVFSDVAELAPAIDVEAVVERDPEVMLASRDAGDDAFGEWRRWPSIAANRYGNHFLLPADELSRPTTRVLVAGAALCEALQTARARRADTGAATDE